MVSLKLGTRIRGQKPARTSVETCRFMLIIQTFNGGSTTLGGSVSIGVAIFRTP